MGARGPKPQPTQLRLLMGNRGRRPTNAKEPVPPADLPDPPPYLSDYAREEWDRQAPILYSTGVLTAVDGTILAAYCMAYGHWRQAEEDLAKMAADDPTTHAALIKTSNGNAIQNPLVGVVNTARRDMARLAQEFGLTPSSRSQIEAGQPPGGQGDADNPARRYFGEAG